MKDDSDPSDPESSPSSLTPPLTVEEEKTFRKKDEDDQELIRLALHKSPFFTCLDDEQVERFIKVAELKTYSAGQSVILEGCVDEVESEEDQLGAPNAKQADAEVERESTGLSSSEISPENEDSDSNNVTEDGFVLVEKPDDATERVEETENSPYVESPAVGGKAEEETDNKNSDEERLALSASDNERIETEDSLQAVGRKNEIQKKTSASMGVSVKDDPHSEHYLEPPPPKSGVPSYIYIIKSGTADVMYSKNISSASIGRGRLFGEGGFLFGRQHSASVLVTSGLLECYVVDATTFRNYVLPSENMTKLYQKHATHVDERDNSLYMTMQDFVKSCLDQDTPAQGSQDQSVEAKPSDISAEPPIQDPLAGVRIANTFNILRNKANDGSFSAQRISLADFCLFHLLMARPDPEVDITFLLIDERKRGVIYKEDIEHFLQRSFDDFKFDMNSDFIHRHFGKDDKNQRGVRPHQFSQFLVDLRQEIGQQIFLQEVEKHGTIEGYLSPTRFVEVLQRACGWRLPDGVSNRLETIYGSDFKEDGDIDGLYASRNKALPTQEPGRDSFDLDFLQRERRPGTHYFSYADFLAFQEVLGQLPGICNLIDRACEIKKGPVSADDFKVANRVLGMGGRLSRRQVEIIFQLFDIDGDGYVSREDTVTVAGAEFTQRIDAVPGRQGALTFAPPPKFRNDAEGAEIQDDSFWVLVQNFSLTSIAGAIGVFALAPLDLVKTRMMNDRVSNTGKRMYQHSLDCLTLAVRSEGYFGLYRGLLPQLIGIAPEKAIQLAVNDLLLQSLVSENEGPGKSGLQYLQEMVAGGCAGACQLLISNPIEIVKIRMQLQGETARILEARGYENPVPQSLRAVVRTLGYSGLFTGARACLLRDIPFGAIYFPTYSFLKENLYNGEGPSRTVSAANLLMAGTLAGVPASLFTTPADVIKTRLQVIPRPGEMKYDGIRDCFTKIYEREGPTAFFRGAAPRVARICPQFGISLVAYEQLSQLLGVKGLLSPTTVPVDPRDYFLAFPARAINTKTDDRLLKNLGSNSVRPGDAKQDHR